MHAPDVIEIAIEIAMGDEVLRPAGTQRVQGIMRIDDEQPTRWEARRGPTEASARGEDTYASRGSESGEKKLKRARRKILERVRIHNDPLVTVNAHAS